MDDQTVKKITKSNGEIFWEYQGVRYPEICRKGNACAQIATLAARYCQGTGIDVGAGNYPFGNAFPVRNNAVNAYNLDCFREESLDYVFSSHCLEHLDDPALALRVWARKIKPGGIMFLYLPHPDMALWRAGGPWVKRAHKWIPTYEKVSELIAAAGLQVIGGRAEKDDFWSFHVIGRK